MLTIHYSVLYIYIYIYNWIAEKREKENTQKARILLSTLFFKI